jgi:hypothetical protein
MSRPRAPRDFILNRCTQLLNAWRRRRVASPRTIVIEFSIAMSALSGIGDILSKRAGRG